MRLQSRRLQTPAKADIILTINGFNGVGNVQFSAGGQRPEEGGGVGGAREALAGLLDALTVVNFQVYDGATGAHGKYISSSSKR